MSRVPLGELLSNVAAVMRTLREENVELQEALSVLTDSNALDIIPLEKLQCLDRHAQIHEDVERLLEAMGDSLGETGMPETRILTALKLEAMRQQFLDPPEGGPDYVAGELALF